MFQKIKFSDNLDCDVRRGVKLYTSISNLCIALVNKKYLFFPPVQSISPFWAPPPGSLSMKKKTMHLHLKRGPQNQDAMVLMNSFLSAGVDRATRLSSYVARLDLFSSSCKSSHVQFRANLCTDRCCWLLLGRSCEADNETVSASLFLKFIVVVLPFL